MTDSKLADDFRNYALAIFDSTADCDIGLDTIRDALEEADWSEPILTTLRLPETSREGVLEDIAVMMSEFVDNWPYPKKISTALALIAKTMRAALDPPKHKYWGAGEPDCPREIKAGNGELHTLRCKVCGKDNPRDDRCLAALQSTPTEEPHRASLYQEVPAEVALQRALDANDCEIVARSIVGPTNHDAFKAVAASLRSLASKENSDGQD